MSERPRSERPRSERTIRNRVIALFTDPARADNLGAAGKIDVRDVDINILNY